MPTPYGLPSIEANPTCAVWRTDGETGHTGDAREMLAWYIETARGQHGCHDAGRQNPQAPSATPALHPCMNLELFCTAQWLRSLLPTDGPDASVRAGVTRWIDELARPSAVMTSEQAPLLGPCKRDLLALCQALEADPRPSTVAAVCRELRGAFCGFSAAEMPSTTLTTSVAAALAAASEQGGPSRPAATRASPGPVAIPQRCLGDIPEDRFTGLKPRKRGETETLDEFLARVGGAAFNDLDTALGDLEGSATRAGLPPALVTRALAPVRATVGVMRSERVTGTDDEVLSLGLLPYALDQLRARLDLLACDRDKASAALSDLMSRWAWPGVSSRARVAALFQTMKRLDRDLAGADPLSRAFLGERDQMVAEMLAQRAEALDDRLVDKFRSRDDGVAAARGQMAQLLALPASEPVSDRDEVDATTLTRAIFEGMPGWRDGAVLARFARRQMDAVIQAVEKRIGTRWEELNVDAVTLAIGKLASLESGRDGRWSLPMPDSVFVTYPTQVPKMQRDANALGLYWAKRLHQQGLVRERPVPEASWEPRTHPILKGAGRVWQFQGALCAVDVDVEVGKDEGSVWLPIDRWVADEKADMFKSGRLRRVVVDALETVEPGSSRQLRRWQIAADGTIDILSAAPRVPQAPQAPEVLQVPREGATAAIATPAVDSASPPFEAQAFMQRLSSAVDRLRAHVVEAGFPVDGLDALMQRVAGKRPGDGDFDEVGMLHLLGVDGLHRICDALDNVAPGMLSPAYIFPILNGFLKGSRSTMGILNAALVLSPALWGHKPAQKMHKAREDFLRHEVAVQALALPEQGRAAVVSRTRDYLRKLLGWDPQGVLLSRDDRAQAERLFDLSATGLAALHHAAEAAARKVTSRTSPPDRRA